jgi:hypothetical protein
MAVFGARRDIKDGNVKGVEGGAGIIGVLLIRTG